MPDTAPATPHPYQSLTPDAVLDALAGVGLYGDGRLQALSSYENRVYQVGIEDEKPVVVKFYRPGRWSDAQIQEEHDFALELAAAEVEWHCGMGIGEEEIRLVADQGVKIGFDPPAIGQEGGVEGTARRLERLQPSREEGHRQRVKRGKADEARLVRRAQRLSRAIEGADRLLGDRQETAPRRR